MQTLFHHYGVELQHFSPNAITVAAVFAAVCEGYLGMMPHWELWLHLYRGELCNTLGVCHLLSTRFEFKHDKFNGNKEVKVNL